ncbi:PKD domain-containing protein [Halosolutus gelatinilyticus]|uniref:PKD domain-containing protein n=1 Tax=Halosolutus gelatinilyticus TaxID=2931975 RepID=UPI001FF10B06|nr:PKD domain-containing protein [Halosolutus gelatinilyticus]
MNNSRGNGTGPARIDRRTMLRTAGVALGGSGIAGITGASRSDPEPEVVFRDQRTDGSSLTIARAATDVDGFVSIGRNDPTDIIWGSRKRLNLAAGDVVEDVDLFPVELPSDSDELSLTAYLWESNGSVLDEDTAIVRVDSSGRTGGIDELRVDADPERGFNYPYFLYAPDSSASEDETPTEKPILVEPVNTGTPDDDFAVHREAAEQTLDSGKTLAYRIGVPFVVPVFPRSESDPVDWTHYTHALDDSTLAIEGGPLERIDLQLLRMVEDAQDRLHERGIPIREGRDDVILNGFSASGNFVDRFAHLHPDRVLSVTAGGLNGMPLLPVDEVDGTPLPFHVGVADLEELTGEPYDADAVDEVNQFLYMGAEDDNDTIPYDDAWSDDDLRDLALDVYGEDMIAERFPRSQEIYREAGVDAQFRVYEDAGHTPIPAIGDIAAFHRRSIDGEDVSEFGQNLVPEVTFATTTEVPTAGEEVTFDARDSGSVRREVVVYAWDFGDGTTATGETMSHSFAEPGEYAVKLTIVLDDGTEETRTKPVTVAAANDSDGTEAADPTEGENSVDDDSAASEDSAGGEEMVDESWDSVPGFGAIGTLVSATGVGYLLTRRFGDGPSER